MKSLDVLADLVVDDDYDDDYDKYGRVKNLLKSNHKKVIIDSIS